MKEMKLDVVKDEGDKESGKRIAFASPILAMHPAQDLPSVVQADP